MFGLGFVKTLLFRDEERDGDSSGSVTSDDPEEITEIEGTINEVDKNKDTVDGSSEELIIKESIEDIEKSEDTKVEASKSPNRELLLSLSNNLKSIQLEISNFLNSSITDGLEHSEDNFKETFSIISNFASSASEALENINSEGILKEERIKETFPNFEIKYSNYFNVGSKLTDEDLEEDFRRRLKVVIIESTDKSLFDITDVEELNKIMVALMVDLMVKLALCTCEICPCIDILKVNIEIVSDRISELTKDKSESEINEILKSPFVAAFDRSNVNIGDKEKEILRQLFRDEDDSSKEMTISDLLMSLNFD